MAESDTPPFELVNAVWDAFRSGLTDEQRSMEIGVLGNRALSKVPDLTRERLVAALQELEESCRVHCPEGYRLQSRVYLVEKAEFVRQ